MKRAFSLLPILLLMIACSSAAVATQLPATSPPAVAIPVTSVDRANRKVNQFFGKFVGKDTPGGAVIVLQNGKTLYKAAYGLANLQDGAPLTTSYMFHIASMGKQMTSLAIMMLTWQGKLSYDDPVGKYVPEVQQFGDAFTIRQLLHHTSGMPDYTDKIQDALFTLADQPTNDDLVTVLSKMKKLPTKPGNAFEYSNTGYDLLAVVIERVSGQKFPEFMQSHIFNPLGMEHTFSLPNAKRRADPLVAMSYTGSKDAPEVYPSDDLDGLYGSGSIYTTVDDMALYDEALYAGTLLPVSVFKEAFQPAQLNDGSEEPYGFGWELEKANGEAYVAHSGAWLGFNSDYVRLLDRHLSVIVMLNRDYEYPDDPRIALKIAQFYLKP